MYHQRALSDLGVGKMVPPKQAPGFYLTGSDACRCWSMVGRCPWILWRAVVGDIELRFR